MRAISPARTRPARRSSRGDSAYFLGPDVVKPLPREQRRPLRSKNGAGDSGKDHAHLDKLTGGNVARGQSGSQPQSAPRLVTPLTEDGGPR